MFLLYHVHISCQAACLFDFSHFIHSLVSLSGEETRTYTSANEVYFAERLSFFLFVCLSFSNFT